MNRAGYFFKKCESLRARKRFTFQDFEVFYTRPDAAIRATFNPNAAKGYTWLPHTGVSAGESMTGKHRNETCCRCALQEVPSSHGTNSGSDLSKRRADLSSKLWGTGGMTMGLFPR